MSPKTGIQRFATLILASIAGTQLAVADWINLTGAETAPNIAEIYVLDDRVHVKLEVYVGDLDKFEDLVPDEWLRDTTGRASLEERLERFSREGLQFVTDSGERLDFRIDPRFRVDRFSRPGQLEREVLWSREVDGGFVFEEDLHPCLDELGFQMFVLLGRDRDREVVHAAEHFGVGAEVESGEVEEGKGVTIPDVEEEMRRIDPDAYSDLERPQDPRELEAALSEALEAQAAAARAAQGGVSQEE